MARKPRGFQIVAQDGGFYVRFRHEGHRHKVSLRTGDPGEAERAAPRVYAEVIEGRRHPRSVATAAAPLPELCASWLASLEGPGGLDPKTRATYLGYARRWLLRWERLADLTSSALRGYLRDRLGEVSRKTARKEKSALSGFLRWCLDQELLAEVPALSLPARAAGTRQRDRRPVPLSPEEVARLLAALPPWSPRPVRSGALFPVRAYAEFLYETGLRPATVARLVRPRAWDRGRRELVIGDDQDKAQMGRAVPLSRRAVELLEEHAPLGEGPLWGRYRLDKLFRIAGKASGLDADRASRVCPYDLRHARLTHLSDAGATRGGLQLLAGHRSAGTTDHYLHPQAEGARAALLALDPPARCPALDGACKGQPIGTGIGTGTPAGPLCRGPGRGGDCPVIPRGCAQGGT
jgi:integrase